MSYWIALLITISVETIVATALFRLLTVDGPGLQRVFPCILAINLLSHPLGWFSVASLGVSWGAVEVGVVLIEVGLVRVALTPKLWLAALVAVTANGITMTLGHNIFW